MATMKSPRELIPHAKRRISRIFSSFELVCAEKIGAGDGTADPFLAFKSKNSSDAARLRNRAERWTLAFFHLEVRRARAA
jgi:hypothetical protein